MMDSTTLTNLWWKKDKNGIEFLTGNLCETKTLFQAEMDPDLENEVWYERPHLFDKPRENTDR